jgi:SNF2 family DNA or RNA helicase
MQKLPPVRVGDQVRVRRQKWNVADVRPYDDCQVVTVCGREVLNFGATRRFISPFDELDVGASRSRIRIVSLRKWRRAIRAQVARDGPADKLRTACAARMELHAYQLEPALAIIRGLGCRILIADEVGLGKTIQAGLIAAELLARGAAERILILTPAGLREQWAQEFAARFALSACVVDMAALRRRAAELPVGVNPWTTMPIAVASFDYVKRPEVAPAVASTRWDVVIVDEAHGVTSGTDRHSAIHSLCALAPYVVLLTATPHNGDPAAFDSLFDLGSRGDGPVLVIRRSRQDVGLGRNRRVHRLYVQPSEAEQRMHRALAELARTVTSSGHPERDSWLALTVLHKRALSSARSLERSAARMMSALPGEAAEDLWQLPLPLDDPGGELDPRDEAPIFATNALGNAAMSRRLQTLVDASRLATAHETKLARLRRLIRRLNARGERAIVFTEYRDTLAHVRSTLTTDVAVLHGGLAGNERRAELDSFTSGRRSVLLATDAAGEGLNLHHACRVVINLELPWSPTRLEQRIGRVDRIGQERRVHVFHLIARGTGEMHLLDFLRRKLTRARQDIATADPLGEFPNDEEDVIAWMLGAADSR